MLGTDALLAEDFRTMRIPHGLVAHASLTAGTRIPARPVPLTVQRLVMEAGVNRDFAPIHHDGAAAKRSGAPDVFANYVFLQSLVEFTIRDWAGLRAKITRIKLRLRSFSCVGTTLECSGEVTRVESNTGSMRVAAAVLITAGNEITAEGTCEILFPDGVVRA